MQEKHRNILKIVYERFIDNEGNGWNEIDENLSYYEWLTDEDLIAEAGVKHSRHSKGIFRCKDNHEQIHCFAPVLLQAVTIILNVWNNEKILEDRYKYILQYYLCMSEMALIYVE